jgi:hypothetical protein
MQGPKQVFGCLRWLTTSGGSEFLLGVVSTAGWDSRMVHTNCSAFATARMLAAVPSVVALGNSNELAVIHDGAADTRRVREMLARALLCMLPQGDDGVDRWPVTSRQQHWQQIFTCHDVAVVAGQHAQLLNWCKK